MRLIEADDLELYAINTGEFYATHKKLVGQGHDKWQAHVLKKVIPRYCREFGPVQASPKTVATVTMALKAYYERHARES